MIIVRLRGGLGNQMFQYAAGKFLAHKKGQALALDLGWFSSPGAVSPKREYDLDIFRIRPRTASGLQIFVAKLLGNYLDGFWQEERYFSEIREDIRNDFTFAKEFEAGSRGLARDIADSDSVCVNVRRGDFVSDGKAVDLSYYEKAVKKMLESMPQSRFFIFSDDMEWCKTHLTFIPNAVFVGHEHAGEKFGNYLQLMCGCKNFIIPNSTFAWWAAWLGKNPQKIVMAPREWAQGENSHTNSIIPSEWLKI